MKASLEMALVPSKVHVTELSFLARLEMTVGRLLLSKHLLNITHCFNTCTNPLSSSLSFLYSKGKNACDGNEEEIGNDSW
jgi:hypothetical protein